MDVKITFLISAIVLIIAYFLNGRKSVFELAELESCPFCYGDDLCDEILNNKISLQYKSFSHVFNNLLGVKNVYFASLNNKDVVLKKLCHDSEFKEIDFNSIVEFDYDVRIEKLVNRNGENHFTVCNRETAELFFEEITRLNIKNASVLIEINVEPVIFQIFNSIRGWNVPKLYGFCGRLVVVENAGMSLNYVEKSDWFKRAYVAFQILRSAIDFSVSHDKFRLYLTDLSPDNICVSDDYKVTFVDLESCVLTRKTGVGNQVKHIHYSDDLSEDSFAFSKNGICSSSLSDHNIYAVCALILSKKATWPMMTNGLLHSPPQNILSEHGKLFEKIELCRYSVDKLNRFKLSDDILSELAYIITKNTEYKVN